MSPMRSIDSATTGKLGHCCAWLLLATLSLGLLSACATPEPPTPRAPAPGPQSSAPTAVDPLTVISSEEQVAQRLRLLQQGADALDAEAAGYFSDVFHARLRQDLSTSGIGMVMQAGSVQLSLPGQMGFAFGSAELVPEAAATLDLVAGILAEFRSTLIIISGHTDNTGNHQVNQRLSEQRARAVGRKLLASGVQPQRVMIRGFGPDQPLASNETEHGRALNRRVEISIETVIRPATGSAQLAPPQQGQQPGS